MERARADDARNVEQRDGHGARRIDRAEQEQAVIDLVLRGPEQSDNGLGAGGRSLTGSLFSAEMLRALSDARHEH